MTLRILLTIHAALTFTATHVLAFAPGAIPHAVGIQIEPEAYLLAYLLAAMELGLAVLSWGARDVTDVKALRVIVAALITVHAASGLLEVYAYAGGALSSAVWANVALRVLAVALFGYYGPMGGHASSKR